ncbi:MAG TPA: hypothetical protein VJB14_12040 [Planctomycetota bacterium]|nr:hypothetical protein [Planctomycetota bacterium]
MSQFHPPSGFCTVHIRSSAFRVSGWSFPLPSASLTARPIAATRTSASHRGPFASHRSLTSSSVNLRTAAWAGRPAAWVEPVQR